MNVHARLAAASLMLMTVATACSQQPDKAAEPAPSTPAAVPASDIHAFRIGQVEAVALRDGTIVLTNAEEQSPWSAVADVATVLTGNGVADNRIHLSVQPLLVKDGERVVLIDTGAGGEMGTENKLSASLASAGVQPGQVTDILISHSHGDHIGGLVANGALVYPNAAVRMTAAEWSAMQGDNELQPVVDLMR